LQVAYYDYALDIILDIETPQDEMLTEEQQVHFSY
jgi:casein kinase II subunit beta